MNNRVTFSFDAVSYGNLQELKKKGRFRTVADTVRDALIIRKVLHLQSEQGFTEVVLRDPVSGRERVIELEYEPAE